MRAFVTYYFERTDIKTKQKSIITLADRYDRNVNDLKDKLNLVFKDIATFETVNQKTVYC